MKGTDKSFENLTCSSPEQCPKLELLKHPLILQQFKKGTFYQYKSA